MARTALLLLPIPLLSSRSMPEVKSNQTSFGSLHRDVVLERKLLRMARRGGPVVLGVAHRPWEHRTVGRSPLEALRPFEGLEISIVTRSAGLLGDLELLIDLDRRCSVQVDAVIPADDSRSVGSCLRLITSLAAEGIAVRVLCLQEAFGADDREEGLRNLLASVRKAGAWDVVAGGPPRRCFPWRLSPRRGQQRATFHRLRLEYGFPRAQPGRG